MNYCLCVSGNLGKIVLEYLTNQAIQISVVFTDKNSLEIIDFCESKFLPCFVGNPRNMKASKWLATKTISFEVLLSINYLFILENDIINIPEIAINFHGSLLPKYRGRTPHVWAIINGESKTGITAHLMNAKCDDGDIVLQKEVIIDDNDTGADILHKYEILYPQMVNEVINMINSNNMLLQHQDSSKATYFGKRTPNDGKIDWNWQKERIRNWVRAQAFPYPGAFTYCNEKKIVINKIQFSDHGFIDTIPNGTILDIINDCPYVKTPNGVVIISECVSDIEININDRLY